MKVCASCRADGPDRTGRTGGRADALERAGRVVGGVSRTGREPRTMQPNGRARSFRALPAARVCAPQAAARRRLETNSRAGPPSARCAHSRQARLTMGRPARPPAPQQARLLCVCLPVCAAAAVTQPFEARALDSAQRPAGMDAQTGHSPRRSRRRKWPSTRTAPI